MRTLERQQNNELDKKMKKTEKNIEAVIRMQKNRLLIMLNYISPSLNITLINIYFSRFLSCENITFSK